MCFAQETHLREFRTIMHEMPTLAIKSPQVPYNCFASQVKVWLGDEEHAGGKHYYIMSRYLICRMLTVTKIPQMKVRDMLMSYEQRRGLEVMLIIGRLH